MCASFYFKLNFIADFLFSKEPTRKVYNLVTRDSLCRPDIIHAMDIKTLISYPDPQTSFWKSTIFTNGRYRPSTMLKMVEKLNEDLDNEKMHVVFRDYMPYQPKLMPLAEHYSKNGFYCDIMKEKTKGNPRFQTWPDTSTNLKTRRLRQELNIDMDKPFDKGEETRKRQAREPVPVPEPLVKKGRPDGERQKKASEYANSTKPRGRPVKNLIPNPSPVPSERTMSAAEVLVSMREAAAGEAAAMEKDPRQEVPAPQEGDPVSQEEAADEEQEEEEIQMDSQQVQEPAPFQRPPPQAMPSPSPQVQQLCNEYVEFLKSRALQADKLTEELTEKKIEFARLEAEKKAAEAKATELENKKKAADAMIFGLTEKVAVLTYVQGEKVKLEEEKKAGDANVLELNKQVAELRGKQEMFEFILKDNKTFHEEVVTSKNAHIATISAESQRKEAIAQERYNDTYNLLADTIKEKQETIDKLSSRGRGRPAKDV